MRLAFRRLVLKSLPGGFAVSGRVPAEAQRLTDFSSNEDRSTARLPQAVFARAFPEGQIGFAFEAFEKRLTLGW
jgi:hypothetical protein